MTEAEWRTCDYAWPMLHHLAGQTPRKHRLFCVACCRRVAAHRHDCDALVVAERYADGGERGETLAQARQRIGSAGGAPLGLGQTAEAVCVAHAVAEACAPDALLRPGLVLDWLVDCFHPCSVDFVQRCVGQRRLLRDIFGNPFRPVAFNPDWRTDTAMTLARGMYESRDFSAMPILADTLQDAGCDNDDILNHCRDEKQVHVRGCWVVDLVLGKE
jgi:hypothetical protein